MDWRCLFLSLMSNGDPVAPALTGRMISCWTELIWKSSMCVQMRETMRKEGFRTTPTLRVAVIVCFTYLQ